MGQWHLLVKFGDIRTGRENPEQSG